LEGQILIGEFKLDITDFSSVFFIGCTHF